MKKIIAIFIIISFILIGNVAYCSNSTIINEKNVGQLVQIKEHELNELKDYTEIYGSEAYGLTAYVLNKVRIYSIPCCFIGIAIAAIWQYVLGVRKIDVRDKGLILMISMITIFVICQVLPLIFAIVVKSWRG